MRTFMTSRRPESENPKYNGKRLSPEEINKRLIGSLRGQKIVAAKSGHIALLKNAHAISSYISVNSKPLSETPTLDKAYWDGRRQSIETLAMEFEGKEAEKVILPIDALAIDESIFSEGDLELQDYYDSLGVGAMPPIVIDEHNQIIDGKYRIRSIFKNGATHVCAYKLQPEGWYENNKSLPLSPGI